MHETLTDTSNSVSTFYYLSPMSYIEGKQEIVGRYALFDNKTYMMIYILSLAIISIFIQSYGLTYDFIHYNDVIMSRIIFTTCMMKRKFSEVIQLFKLLKDMNFCMVCAFVTSS